jgi:hypothetical protein
VVVWSKGGRDEGLGILWLAMGFGTTAPCSPASLYRISLTMPGFEKLQLVPSPSDRANVQVAQIGEYLKHQSH